MKHTLTILSGLLLLAGYFPGTGHKGQRILVPTPEKYVQDGYSQQSDSLKSRFRPDTTIGQISLLNAKNAEAYLGKHVMDSLTDDKLPNASVISSDSTQRLTFYFHPGNAAKEFSAFQISYVDQIRSNEKVTKDKVFKTESGIKPGLTMDELRSIKGKPDSVSLSMTISMTITKHFSMSTKSEADTSKPDTTETTVWHYKIDDFKNAEFLKRYNIPAYYADYKFKNGYLAEFRFGFAYL